MTTIAFPSADGRGGRRVGVGQDVAGATIIVIDHDLDLLAAADHLVDMGPGGGPDGGHIVAAGTPEDVARHPGSVTGPWLAEHLGLLEARPPGLPVGPGHGDRMA